MTHAFLSQTFIAASQKLDQACDWIEALGIQYSPTRLGRYKALFSSLAKHQSSNSLDGFFEEYTRGALFNAAHEAAQVVRIYEGLVDQTDPQLVPRVREALRGHELFILDHEDRSGRDFTFELAIASKFARAGLPVNFGHRADLQTRYQEFEFFVECKRLK